MVGGFEVVNVVGSEGVVKCLVVQCMQWGLCNE